MASLNVAERVFRMQARDFPDPDPSMKPSEVLMHYARQFPKLLGGKVIDPVHEDGKHVYEMRPSFGDKG